MAVIRVVLAVALATALFGVSLPVAEGVDRDRSATLAMTELEALASAANRLAAENDPVAADKPPAETTVVVDPPDPRLTEGGRLVIEDNRFVWWPRRGPNRTVHSEVRTRVETPLVLTARIRLRLSFVSVNGTAVVQVTSARVQEGSPDQTARARRTPIDRLGMPV